jgi:hypothetical protein
MTHLLLEQSRSLLDVVNIAVIVQSNFRVSVKLSINRDKPDTPDRRRVIATVLIGQIA